MESGCRVASSVILLNLNCAMHSSNYTKLYSNLRELFNAKSWVSQGARYPCKLHFSFSEIKSLVTRLRVEFFDVIRSANGLADYLAKQG